MFNMLSKINTQKLIAFFVFIIGLILVITGVSITLKSKIAYFFSDYDYGNNFENTSNNYNYNSNSTVIKYDNVYYGVTIETKKDADELIKEDSINQKNNCPSKIQEIENEMISKYNITAVNLCEMDYEFAKELISVIDKIYKEYPGARGYLTNLTLKRANEGVATEDATIAAFMPAFPFTYANTSSQLPSVIKTQVLLNDSYFLNEKKLEKSTDYSSKEGWFPKNSNKLAPLAHELGHYISYLAMMKSKNIDSTLIIDEKEYDKFYDLLKDFSVGTFSLSLLQEAYGNYKKDTNSNISFDDFRRTISIYAMAKDENGNYIYDETIAEAFHDVYLNGDNATLASIYIVRVLKQKLNGGN